MPRSTSSQAIRSRTKLAGNVVDLCPVGALGSKDFFTKQRVWYLQKPRVFALGCSTGCSIAVDRNKDVVFRLRPRENPQAQGHFFAMRGAMVITTSTPPSAIRRPLVRRDDGSFTPRMTTIIQAIRQALQDAASRGDVYGILSPFLSVEEAFLAANGSAPLGRTQKLVIGTRSRSLV